MLQRAVDDSSDSRKLLATAEMRIALASAYMERLSIGEGGLPDLERAAESLAAAVKFLHPDIQPFLWLGYVVVSSAIALLISHTDLPGDAMDALGPAEGNLRRALDCLPADQSPIGRGTAQLLLGSLLERQADLSTGSDKTQEAEDAYAAAAALLGEDIAPSFHNVAVLAFERIRGAS